MVSRPETSGIAVPAAGLVLSPSIAERMVMEFGPREREIESFSESFEAEWSFLDGTVSPGKYSRWRALTENVGPSVAEGKAVERVERVVEAEKIVDVEEIDELAESEGGGDMVEEESRKRKADSSEEPPRSSPFKTALVADLSFLATSNARAKVKIRRSEAKERLGALLRMSIGDLDGLLLEFPESGPRVALVSRGHKQMLDELERM